MIKYFKNSFKITNENIILTTPLVLFLFLLSLYMGLASNLQGNIQSAILLLSTIIFMLAAFFAGWFYMVKKAIELDRLTLLSSEEKAKESFGLIKQIPTGVGEYFLPFIGGIILFVALFVVLIYLGHTIGSHFIGKLGINLSQLKVALESPIAMKSFVASLSSEQLIRLKNWNLLLLAIMAFFSFITIYWPAQIVYRTKNPFFAFFKSVVFIFKNLLPTLILFLYISVINFVVSVINTIAAANTITYFIALLIYFYFLVYVVVLIFLYYDEQSSKVEQAKSNCDCRSDGIGQDCFCDSKSERD